MGEHIETATESRLVYDGKIVHLYVDKVTLENGRQATREVVRHGGAACIVPVYGNGDVLLVRQYRYPFARVLLELPAGKLDPGEEMTACAHRELAEETGVTADSMEYLGPFYPSVGYLDEVIHLFAARGLHEGQTHPDEDEFVDSVRIPLEQAAQMVLRGEIPDGKTQAGILRVYCGAPAKDN